MSEQTEKHTIINREYHNPIYANASAVKTLSQAKSIDKSITLQDVKDYFVQAPTKTITIQI